MNGLSQRKHRVVTQQLAAEIRRTQEVVLALLEVRERGFFGRLKWLLLGR